MDFLFFFLCDGFNPLLIIYTSWPSLYSYSCLRNCTLFPYCQQTGHDAQPARSGLTRIPMSKSLKTGKAVLGTMGISSGVKLESRTESQSMRVEVKKSTVNNSTFQSGGKPWLSLIKYIWLWCSNRWISCHNKGKIHFFLKKTEQNKQIKKPLTSNFSQVLCTLCLIPINAYIYIDTYSPYFQCEF